MVHLNDKKLQDMLVFTHTLVLKPPRLVASSRTITCQYLVNLKHGRVVPGRTQSMQLFVRHEGLFRSPVDAENNEKVLYGLQIN